MVARSSAAPPAPRSKKLAEPKIHKTAYVHPQTQIIGDVQVDANVLVSPGTSIRADEGSPFYIGESTNIQDGVLIHGLKQGRVIGDDKNHYSVWVGKNASITHMALIHGPAYIGDNCFIGFRSTVFNARVGQGCIVMMHALIQDVEIPAGKFVPSGAVITNQQQADRLPNVQAQDMEFARYVVGINDALRSAEEDNTSITPIRNELAQSNGSKGANSSRNASSTSVNSETMNSEIVEQVRQLLSQGYKIGTEHVDERRFRTGSWQSCSPVPTTSAREAVAALEDCLESHAGEYVRLFGIDPKGKRRVMETIIQRPDGQTPQQSSKATASPASSSNYSLSSYGSESVSSTQLGTETVEQVRQLLNQGYKIGTEHVDERRFRTGSWQSCSPLPTASAKEAVAALEECLANHAGEYVRMIGIDPKGKRRVMETIIQRPDGKVTGQVSKSMSMPQTSNSVPAVSSNNSKISSARLSAETIEQIRQLLYQGYKVGMEHVDERRFRTGSWQSCSPMPITSEQEAVAALEECLDNHAGEYVRLVGIDPKAKRRVLETIIQRP